MRMLTYWKKELNSKSGYLDLPADFRRPAMPSNNGKEILLEISEEQGIRILNFCEHEKVNEFTILLSAYFVLLRAYSG